eukprot:5919087-Pyramimonas_sp.AAC.1
MSESLQSNLCALIRKSTPTGPAKSILLRRAQYFIPEAGASMISDFRLNVKRVVKDTSMYIGAAPLRLLTASFNTSAAVGCLAVSLGAFRHPLGKTWARLTTI